jgi:hypothetical protein
MIDKKYWVDFRLSEKRIPQINCPTCKKGILEKMDDFIQHKTKHFIEASKYDTFEPESDVEYKFTGFLKCSEKECEEIIALTGTVICDVEEYQYDEGTDTHYPTYMEIFVPEFFTPNLEIFPLLEVYPTQVSSALKKSFKLFFCDIEASANKIRTAVELLLDKLRIKKYTPSKKTPISLHKRLLEYQTKNKELADFLMAIKFIGNSGSHSKKSLKRSDLIDAYNLIKRVLDKLYDNSDEDLKKIARKINRRRKPMSHK